MKFYKLTLTSNNRFFAWLSMITEERILTSYFEFLKAAYRYEKSSTGGEFNIYILRRNIHRIEKGLTMRPMRKEFALRFILPTVKGFCRLAKDQSFTLSSEYDWAAGVLRMYFAMTSSDDQRYQDSKVQYDQFVVDSNGFNAEEIPVGYSAIETTDEFESLNSLCLHRKSVRWFDSRPVSKDSLIKALKCATLAPSSCNRQPYRYDIITSPEKSSKIARISAGTIGWAHNVNCIAVLVGDLSAFSNIANRHSIYVDGTLSVMPFVLSLEAQGLSTCIINWADISVNEEEMRKALGLACHEKVILSIAIGYSDKNIKVPFSKRKAVSEISRFIE